MSWRPSSSADVARQRAMLLDRTRSYFRDQSVLEVDTPALSSSAVSDPNIKSLSVAGVDDGVARLFLHTSPEFCMKRMLADGYPDIYSICRVFRGGELGRSHQPEFTMVEWYRLEFGLAEIIEDTLRLLAVALGDRTPTRPPAQLTYRQAFIDTVGVDPLTTNTEALAHATTKDEALRDAIGDDRNAWLDLLFSTTVADSFPGDRLTVVTHFPAGQAALARLDDDDASVAERFEVFSGALELANGYVELTDEIELRARFRSDLDKRAATGSTVPPLDERFLQAMRSGLPACAGVALGFERLHMLYAGTRNIRDVISFEFET
ncbi:MAG: EF-P lysine aminoacylase EpmA [Woeseiaceae bacterium]|nr:EF-P lysine aminoacylase EpmA [Woeseiaceae bacterium]